MSQINIYKIDQKKISGFLGEMSTKFYKNKHNLRVDNPEIENVAIWLVLERTHKLKLVDGNPDLNSLDMLMLKNRIDSWKKEVRLLGYKPIIYVNYAVA